MYCDKNGSTLLHFPFTQHSRSRSTAAASQSALLFTSNSLSKKHRFPFRLKLKFHLKSHFKTTETFERGAPKALNDFQNTEPVSTVSSSHHSGQSWFENGYSWAFQDILDDQTRQLSVDADPDDSEGCYHELFTPELVQNVKCYSSSWLKTNRYQQNTLSSSVPLLSVWWSSMFILLLCHLPCPVHSHEAGIYVQSALQEDDKHSVQCYSCMSGVYEGLWDTLQKTYSRPRNFSKTCDKGQNQKGIGLVDCPSICIKMWEEVIVGGYPVLGFMRGCYDTMLLRGFNQTLVRWYRWLQRDSCHYYPRKDVLQLPFNMPGHIYICTCYNDGCNGTPSLSAAIKITSPLTIGGPPIPWRGQMLLLVILTLLWRFHWTYGSL